MGGEWDVMAKARRLCVGVPLCLLGLSIATTRNNVACCSQVFKATLGFPGYAPGHTASSGACPTFQALSLRQLLMQAGVAEG